MVPVKNISVIILAGGLSSRMGKDKRNVRIAGKSLFSYSLELALAFSEDIIISSNDRLPEFEHHKVVSDKITGAGPVQAIISSLPHITSPAAVVLTSDMPFVTIHQLKLLAREFTSDKIISFILDGKIQPFPSLFPASFLKLIQLQYENKLHSMKGMIAALPSMAITADRESKEKFINLNRPEELEKAINKYGNTRNIRKES